MFHPPAVAVKLDLGKIKPSSTFLTQMQSARVLKGNKKRAMKSGFLSDRAGASGSKAQGGDVLSLAASEMVIKAFASAARRGSVDGRQ
jgi:hypothetical protein